MAAKSAVRFIACENVSVGDLIRVTHKEGDVDYSRVGRVASRADEGKWRVYYSAQGYEILRWTHAEKTPKVTLIDRRGEPTSVPLSGLDEIREMINGNSSPAVR